MKKRAIILAITLLPTAALAWDNRDRLDDERNYQLERIADQMELDRRDRQMQGYIDHNARIRENERREQRDERRRRN